MDDESRRNYAAGKISMAMDELALGDGDLLARVKKAHRLVAQCSDVAPFTQNLDRIHQTLRTVKLGDYSHVTTSDLRNVAEAVKELYALVLDLDFKASVQHS